LKVATHSNRDVNASIQRYTVASGKPDTFSS
jgi:hypothetical protein